jgi:hypothetical protein
VSAPRRKSLLRQLIQDRRTLTRREVAVRAADRISGGHHLRIPWDPPPIEPQPRWGWGRPPHARLDALLRAGSASYAEVLKGFGAYAAELRAIPLDQEDPLEPHWRSPFMFGTDGATLYGFMRTLKPARYIEVGSGNSTLFVNRARRDGALGTQIISVDPQPRREIDSLCDRVVRTRLEQADLAVFGELEAGAMLFMDGTHRVFMNSDVVTFFLDVLPELAPGVLVGIHDIHLPDDYGPEQNHLYFSEQYMLAAYLLAESPWIQTVLPCWFASHDSDLQDLSKALLPSRLADQNPYGVIFWLRTQPRGR